MYGKIFASLFTGSMMAAGAEVIAVWAYVIANGVKGHVELNPRLLAALIGSTPERMRAAIDTLSEPDPASRSKENDGRRLVREGEYQYVITNLEKYRGILNEDDRREYNRVKKREERARKRAVQTVIDSQRLSSVSAQAEAEADAEEGRDLSSAAQTRRQQAADRLPNCPHQKIVETYHEILPELPKVKVLDLKRKTAMRAAWLFAFNEPRLSDGTTRAVDEATALAWFKDFYLRVREIDWMMGRGKERRFTDFDYLISLRGIKRVIEHKDVPGYDAWAGAI